MASRELPGRTETTLLHRSAPAYPRQLGRCLGPRAPDMIAARGDLGILEGPSLALFCSQQCPGRSILGAYDLAQKLRDAGVTVSGGFHSAMERECLRILLCSPHPVVIGLARGLPQRVPAEFRRPLAESRLLWVSPFAATVRRADEETARQRNRFVAALATLVLIPWAAPGSKTEAFAREIVGWGKPLFTLAGGDNGNLLVLGGQPLDWQSPPWQPSRLPPAD